MIEGFLTRYYDAVYDTNRDGAMRVIDEALEAGITPEQVVFGIVTPSIEKMIQALTLDLDATISQHFIASQVADEVTEKMLALFKTQPGKRGVVILGTPLGDFHGLGKKIVAGCLRANMFQVEDMGLNVSAERFVERADQLGAQIIGVSSMMVHTTTSEDGPRKIRILLDQREMSHRVKLVVGGAPYRFDPKLYKIVGADAYADDGITAASVIGNLIEVAQNETRL